MSSAGLQTLPVELIHRILDNLDTETIFFSLRATCKRFDAIINRYNRYKLDFRYFSKTNFHQLCRSIHFENVISIILSDEDETPGQIGLFLSLIDLHKLIRLQSLTLYLEEKSSLKTFLDHVHVFLLVSLTIKWRRRSTLEVITTNLLSSTIAKLTNLQRLHLELQNYSIESIPWSQENSIQYLFLDRCTWKEAIFALHNLPQLHTLVLSNVNEGFDKNVFITSPKFTSSLKSFTIEQKYMRMNMLESMLTLTPLLVHLKITGSTRQVDYLHNASRWEKFIQTSLTHLKKFEFFFHCHLRLEQTIIDIESIINPFRTYFWLENKHWYIGCDYIKNSGILQLYSMPICESIFSYDCELDKISYSNMPIMNTNPASVMNNISHLRVKVVPEITDDKQPTHRLFNNVTELTLLGQTDCPQSLIAYLSLIIDLSHVRKISLDMTFEQQFLPNIISFFENLFEQAYNIRAIDISYSLSESMTRNNTITICSLLSNRVKHLKILMDNFISMKMILEGNEHLFSITFTSFSSWSNDYDEIILWLQQKKIQFIHFEYDSSLSIWFDHRKDYSSEAKNNYKRFKLTHNN